MLSFGRKRSWQRRVGDAARSAPKRGRQLRAAAAQLDIPFARSRVAGLIREWFMRFVLQPLMDVYAARRATGRERLAGLRGPVILVANHASHMDTPVILAALPRRLRKRTAVAAAADYFYRTGSSRSSSRSSSTRCRSTGAAAASARPAARTSTSCSTRAGTSSCTRRARARATAGPGRVRRGAAVLARAHNLAVVPIRVTGTSAAMPPGRLWPRRLQGKVLSHRHRIEVSFGEPIGPDDEPRVLTERVQRFFEDGDGKGGSPSPYRRLAGRR